jgi:Crp-like helix-turn-helix domain/CBS domain
LLEHLIDVGRRSALERVAHFLLELLMRLQVVELADERSYQMPLTQELLGDALGLSVPHVNRTLRQLHDDGPVAIEEQQVTIRDVDALSVLANTAHLPVVSRQDQKLVGYLSWRDLLRVRVLRQEEERRQAILYREARAAGEASHPAVPHSAHGGLAAGSREEALPITFNRRSR